MRAVCDNELLLQSAVAVVVRREAPRSDAQQRPACYDPHPPAGDIEGTRKRRTPEGVAREDPEEPVPRLQDVASGTLSKLDRIDAATPNWEQLARPDTVAEVKRLPGCEETDRRGRAGKPDVEPPRPGESAHDDEGPLITLRYQRPGENRSTGGGLAADTALPTRLVPQSASPTITRREPPHRNLFRQARRPLPRGDPPPTPAQCQPRSTA